MLYFSSDYMEGCHPNILRRLSEINMDKNPGYGTDAICESAKNKIRAACGKPDAEVYFLVGGTQTNAVVIKSMLRSYEGVVAAATGHVAVHEAGAIEAGGHKVLTLPEHNGKLDAAEVEEYIATFYKDANHEHMVKPGMVYISHPTEYGTLYTKAELEALHGVCAKYDIPVIDLYHNFSINADNYDSYTSDGLHPNEEGHSLIAKAVEKYIKSLM